MTVLTHAILKEESLVEKRKNHLIIVKPALLLEKDEIKIKDSRCYWSMSSIVYSTKHRGRGWTNN